MTMTLIVHYSLDYIGTHEIYFFEFTAGYVVCLLNCPSNIFKLQLFPALTVENLWNRSFLKNFDDLCHVLKHNYEYIPLATWISKSIVSSKTICRFSCVTKFSFHFIFIFSEKSLCCCYFIFIFYSSYVMLSFAVLEIF